MNGGLPNSIVVFRDGVGDGAMKHVASYEVSQFEKAFSKFGDNGSYRPKFAFVVVQKRINTRIFHRQVRSLAGTMTSLTGKCARCYDDTHCDSMYMAFLVAPLFNRRGDNDRILTRY